MPKTVIIPKPLLTLTNNEKIIEVSATTIGEMIAELETRFPGFTEHLLDENGEIRRFANFYVNDEEIRFLKNRETKLNDGDKIVIIPALIDTQSAVAAIDVANRLRLEQQLRKN